MVEERHVVVLTGAGVSADSGLATFRDAGGLWEGRRPEDVATPEAWAADRELVWRFYQVRRRALDDVQPNDAHRALAELARGLAEGGGRCTLVTQNVDDLHERGGSTDVLHMHGELSVLRCEVCGYRVRDRTSLDPSAFVPCGECDQPALRPAVVWFGEVPLFLDEIGEALATCSEFLAIGTSGLVYPAAGLLSLARERGARTWVNSLDPPDNLDPRDDFRPGRAVDVVPELVRGLLDA